MAEAMAGGESGPTDSLASASADDRLPTSTDTSLFPSDEETSVDLPCLQREEESEDNECQIPLRPLSDILLDDSSDVVLTSDEDAPASGPVELELLAPLLNRSEPLLWVFAGLRHSGDPAFGDSRLVGEWFAEEWRAESGRATDMVLDATWPDCTLAMLKSHLRARVARRRADIAVLFLNDSDARAGIEDLGAFERRLLSILSMLAEVGTAVVLVRPAHRPEADDIDGEVYFEAISGIAKERGVSCLTLPDFAPHKTGSRTPNSASRRTALAICQEALKALAPV